MWTLVHMNVHETYNTFTATKPKTLVYNKSHTFLLLGKTNETLVHTKCAKGGTKIKQMQKLLYKRNSLRDLPENNSLP